jgi:predicted GIY-YIG superfamily endonuclease
MRVKGSKDKKKRKVKTILDGNRERDLIEDYEQGMVISELRKKYNVSKSYISNMSKLRNIKKRIDWSVIEQWLEVSDIETIEEGAHGIYALFFVNILDSNNIKVYIGSSTNIKTRLKSHTRDLKIDQHKSTNLSRIYKDNNYTMRYAIIEICSDKEILQKENEYLRRWSDSCLLNRSKPTNEEDVGPWLEAVLKNKAYREGYVINNQTGCKESVSVSKSGYGKAKVTLGGSNIGGRGVTKYLLKHRVAFWEKNGSYPELVRHKCGNRKCYNPDHLESGNHRDNNLDKRGDFPEIFEKAWLELNGDLEKLTEHFSDRWTACQMWKGKTVSYAIYNWEKKLGLRKKYPEILDANSDRRFSLSYQKLGRSKKKKQKGLPTKFS